MSFSEFPHLQKLFNKIPIAKFIKTDLQFHLHFNYDKLVQNFFPIIHISGSNPFILA